MFGWLKKRFFKPKVDTRPVAEYNFGPYDRVYVRGAPIPQIGTIVSLGNTKITSFGALHYFCLDEHSALQFHNECVRWQVTDVEIFLSVCKRTHLAGIEEMEMSPHYRVYLAPVSNTTNLANTLNTGALENV